MGKIDRERVLIRPPISFYFLQSSCFEGENTELMQALDSHIKLHFYQAYRCHSCHFTSLILSQKFRWRDILCRTTLKEAEDGGEDWTADRAEDVNVARVAPWLRRYMCHTIPADHVTTKVISLGESQFYLWPSRHIVGPVANFKWEVPDDPAVSLLWFVCMLANSTFVSLL